MQERSSLPNSARVPVARRRHVIRKVITALLLIVILFPTITAVVLLNSPDVLQAASAWILPPRAGTISWDGRSRIVVALYGLTQRTTEPARTDTILILTIDPARRQGSLLSIPRDLWVNIPGYGQGKLAIAYEVGGPRLTTYTLQHDLGLPVQYYAALTFRGFTHLVDALGGVTVSVPQELVDPTYPCLTTTAYCPIDLKAGSHHFDGATALQFVRERHAFATQDLARVQDQQAFLTALRHQVLSPATVTRLSTLLPLMRHELITDLPDNALPSLALAYASVPQANMNHRYIDQASGLVQTGWSTDGQSILTATTPDRIPVLIDHLTHDPANSTPGNGITVWNGTSTAGLAGDVATALHRDGFVVDAVGNTPHTGREHTLIVRNTLVTGGSTDVAATLARLLQAPVVSRPEHGTRSSIVVLLGADTP